jgi:RNA polymerase sigma-70 factor (ECF subfamily)
MLHHARRAARVVGGIWVPLEQHDPSRYDWRGARAGLAVLRTALARRALGPYQIQAAISALHLASTSGDPRWEEIAGLYATLESIAPSDVVAATDGQAVAAWEVPSPGISSLLGSDGSSTFSAARAPVTGRPRGSSRPTCTSTDAWSQ